MFPNLYFLIEGLLGVQPPQLFSVVQTFGLFMAVSFICAGVVLVKDMKRRTALGQFSPVIRDKVITGNPTASDLIINALIGFILGFKLLYIAQHSTEFINNAPDTLLSTKGSVIGGVIGALLLAASKYWEKRQEAKKYNATELIYVESFEDKKKAKSREKQLKNWHKDWKWNSIKKVNPDLQDLSTRLK